jgi:hypothetical protein
VKEVYHDRSFAPGDVGMVSISCILETRDFEHVTQVGEALKTAGIQYEMR